MRTMGQLFFSSSSESIELDDRTLAHVEIVILAKLRRKESFAITHHAEDGGRETVWLSPTSALRFRYTVGQHEIDREWLEQLIDGANSAGGIQLGNKPA